MDKQTVVKNVKQPSHYIQGRKYEPKDVIRDWGLNFNLGNAVKYLSRAGRKDDVVQDLLKAQEYIQFEINAIEQERAASAQCEQEQEQEKANKKADEILDPHVKFLLRMMNDVDHVCIFGEQND